MVFERSVKELQGQCVVQDIATPRRTTRWTVGLRGRIGKKVGLNACTAGGLITEWAANALTLQDSKRVKTYCARHGVGEKRTLTRQCQFF